MAAAVQHPPQNYDFDETIDCTVGFVTRSFNDTENVWGSFGGGSPARLPLSDTLIDGPSELVQALATAATAAKLAAQRLCNSLSPSEAQRFALLHAADGPSSFLTALADVRNVLPPLDVPERLSPRHSETTEEDPNYNGDGVNEPDWLRRDLKRRWVRESLAHANDDITNATWHASIVAAATVILAAICGGARTSGTLAVATACTTAALHYSRSAASTDGHRRAKAIAERSSELSAALSELLAAMATARRLVKCAQANAMGLTLAVPMPPVARIEAHRARPNNGSGTSGGGSNLRVLRLPALRQKLAEVMRETRRGIEQAQAVLDRTAAAQSPNVRRGLVGLGLRGGGGGFGNLQLAAAPIPSANPLLLWSLESEEADLLKEAHRLVESAEERLFEALLQPNNEASRRGPSATHAALAEVAAAVATAFNGLASVAAAGAAEVRSCIHMAGWRLPASPPSVGTESEAEACLRALYPQLSRLRLKYETSVANLHACQAAVSEALHAISLQRLNAENPQVGNGDSAPGSSGGAVLDNLDVPALARALQLAREAALEAEKEANDTRGGDDGHAWQRCFQLVGIVEKLEVLNSSALSAAAATFTTSEELVESADNTSPPADDNSEDKNSADDDSADDDSADVAPAADGTDDGEPAQEEAAATDDWVEVDREDAATDAQFPDAAEDIIDDRLNATEEEGAQASGCGGGGGGGYGKEPCSSTSGPVAGFAQQSLCTEVLTAFGRKDAPQETFSPADSFVDVSRGEGIGGVDGGRGCVTHLDELKNVLQLRPQPPTRTTSIELSAGAGSGGNGGSGSCASPSAGAGSGGNGSSSLYASPSAKREKEQPPICTPPLVASAGGSAPPMQGVMSCTFLSELCEKLESRSESGGAAAAAAASAGFGAETYGAVHPFDVNPDYFASGEWTTEPSAAGGANEAALGMDAEAVGNAAAAETRTAEGKEL